MALFHRALRGCLMRHSVQPFRGLTKPSVPMDAHSRGRGRSLHLVSGYSEKNVADSESHDDTIMPVMPLLLHARGAFFSRHCLQPLCNLSEPSIGVNTHRRGTGRLSYLSSQSYCGFLRIAGGCFWCLSLGLWSKASGFGTSPSFDNIGHPQSVAQSAFVDLTSKNRRDFYESIHELPHSLALIVWFSDMLGSLKSKAMAWCTVQPTQDGLHSSPEKLDAANWALMSAEEGGVWYGMPDSTD